MRIVLGYSNTGQGHRSSAIAVAESLLRLRPDLDLKLVDLLTEYAPPPFNRAPALYRTAVLSPATWRAVYALGAGPRRARFWNRLTSAYAAAAANRVVEDHDAALFVSFHPATTAPLLRAAGKVAGPRSRVATVVTDLTSMTALWFSAGVDLCIVPSEGGRRAALRSGISDARIRTLGLPVSERFRPPDRTESAAHRGALGWAPDQPVVLVSGGGDGVGPLDAVTDALARLPEAPTVAVVCGHNARLRARLDAQWSPGPGRVHVLGFVPDMYPLMAASDVFVTKAGPCALYEAFSVGLPVVLHHRIAGQEHGNVDLAVRAGAAIWAPGAGRAAAAADGLLRNPDARRRMGACSLAVAKPGAATAVAQALLDLLDHAVPAVPVTHPPTAARVG